MFRNDLSKNYSTAPQPGNPRATEAWALSQSALRMKAGQLCADREEILAAVRLNWRLWTILQSALLEPDCPVPAEIRSNMLSLARFVDKQTVDVFAEPSPDKLDALISINRELAAGLFTNPDLPAPPPPIEGGTREPVRIST
jgi:flagellar biosynthesis activator protein FlaF